MTKIELVRKLHDERVYEYLAEIKGMIENDQCPAHASANKQLHRVLRQMINRNNWMVFSAFEMIEMASALRGMATAFSCMADDGFDLIDHDIAERIDQEWKAITKIIEDALREADHE